MDYYEALENAAKLFTYSDEELHKLPYVLHLQIDGLALRNILLKSVMEDKSIKEFMSDCIEKGLKDE